MTIDGSLLVRMAQLLEVDEVRQVSVTTSPLMEFIVRVGDLKEMVQFNTANLQMSDAADAVRKILYDAARRVRKRFERRSMSPADFAMVVEADRQSYNAYKARTEVDPQVQCLNQSEPRDELRRVFFTCVDERRPQDRLRSVDMAEFVVWLMKNGATFVRSTAPQFVEVDAVNARGQFYVQLSMTDLDTAGRLTVIVTNAGGPKTMLRREITVTVASAQSLAEFVPIPAEDKAKPVDRFAAIAEEMENT